uniref:zinc finger protein OZF-like isoform X1 n=1 Tax=Doryrhamphus excisus TaxID=161450 RepID=UPI0025ADD068|nr:zinc finger protein OZF-like isoform X1 [Doryrhamphus excisus]
MEMHPFIGEIITSTNKEQLDMANVWSMLGGEASLEALQLARPVQDRTEATQRKSKSRDDVRHVCTCPGCPFSSTLESLKHTHALPGSEVACHAKDDTSITAMTSPDGAAEPSSPPGTSDSRQNPDTPISRQSSLSHISSIFPCLCCHHGQLLSQHANRDAAFSHTHHHFHHHHCPISNCLPRPQLGQSHSQQLSAAAASFPCLASLHRQLQEERGRPLTTLASHPCMHCSASFSKPSQLLQHQRSEHAHKPCGFLCMQCGRTFNSHSNLRIHLNVHTGARPYTCSECGKGFSQSGALKIHRRIHTGERPYTCGFCGRGFPHLAGFRAHQRTHTGEKPYRCNQCGKCFTQSGALKIHTRIHTGERPFICTICGKAFSNRSGIRFHNTTVHGLPPDQLGQDRARGRPPASLHTRPDGNNALLTETPSALALLAGSKPPSDGENADRNRDGLMYACEDCGLRFKDAPSRNRHQSQVHYSSEGSVEEGVPKEGGRNAGIGHDSGEEVRVTIV